MFGLKKILPSIFLTFSFSCFAQVPELQNLFFDATKYAATGFSHSYDAKILANANPRAKSFYLKTVFERSEEHNRFVSLYLCEKFNPDRIGEIDLSFSYEDFEHSLVDVVEQAYLMASQKSEIPDGQSILDILEKGDGRGIESEEELKEDEKILQEYAYTEKDGSLRRFSYDSEGMSVNKYGENFYITRMYGKDIVRKTFDQQFRLSCIEKLYIESDARNAKLKNKKDYFYNEDELVVSKTIEEITDKKEKIETRYHENGLPSFILTSHQEEEETKKAENKSKDKKETEAPEPKYVSDKEVKLAYDENRRIVENEETIWKYSKNTFGRTVTNKLNTKYVYDFSATTEENNLPPDYDFYENGELRLHRKYSSAENYVETMYFDDGFSVAVDYENGVKKQEIVYIGEKEMRRRSFE
ncbi:MAG: hypothetical protein KBT11_09305 [Treponema sp.]|nr:hypothetical protein [Candidatus Treponema equifaecale]